MPTKYGIGDDVVVVLNFAATTWENDSYSINFPYAGDWYLVYAQVTAGGSPVGAAVNMGMYSALIYARSKHNQPTPGTASVTPANPADCEDVTIEYYPNDGVLDNVQPVYIQIGKNGWQEVIDPPPEMTWNGSAWEYTYSAIADTFTIDFVFNDGSNIWDNNDGIDWHIDMDECQGAFGTVSNTPLEPTGCEAVTIKYNPNKGPLRNADEVVMFVGYNDWSFTVDPSPSMTSNAGIWEYTIAPPAGIYEMNISFHDNRPTPSERTWDNNQGKNWTILFSSCTEQTDISITSPARTSTETNTAVTILGTSSQSNGAAFEIRNLLTGETQTTGPSNNWEIAAFPLQLGTNIFTASIQGTGVSSNDGDHAAALVYSNGWSTGQNDGSGWNPWILYGSASAGHFIADRTAQLSLDSMTNAWGLWSNEGISEALRPLNHFLAVGSEIAFDMENGMINAEKSTGIALRNIDGDTLMELYFNGGDNHYTLRDGDGYLDTGIGWTDDGFHVSIRLDAPRQYTITIDSSQQWSRSLLGASDQRVRFFRAWNYSAGPGEYYNFYIDNLSVNGGQWADYDTVEVIRVPTAEELDTDDDGMKDTWEQSIIDAKPDDGITAIEHVAPDDDFDGDGMSNLQEYISGTSPTDDSDYFLINTAMNGNGQWGVVFSSHLSRRYKVFYTDSGLLANDWHDASPHQDIWGNDSDIEWIEALPDDISTRLYRVIAELVE